MSGTQALRGKKMASKNKINQDPRFDYVDYDVPCLTLAKKLLGQYLCRRLDSGEELKGIIVETEGYPGGEDRGSMTFGGKKTEKNASLYMGPGTACVYLTYGMYHCYNISSEGEGSAVLIRAVQPIQGLEVMKQNRGRSYKGKNAGNKKNKTFTNLDLCSGPSKLCMSYAIDRSLNKEDMKKSNKLWVERPPQNSVTDGKNEVIVACARIGIDSVGKEWASKPYRFYFNGNPYVSKRDKKAEQNLILEN